MSKTAKIENPKPAPTFSNPITKQDLIIVTNSKTLNAKIGQKYFPPHKIIAMDIKSSLNALMQPVIVTAICGDTLEKTFMMPILFNAINATQRTETATSILLNNSLDLFIQISLRLFRMSYVIITFCK